MKILLNSLSHRATTILLLLSLISLGVIAKNVVVTARPQQGKTVEKATYDSEPVEVVDLRASQKPIQPGEKVAGGDDWLKDLSFRLKNTSHKQIVYAEIALDFSGTQLTYLIRFGQRPGVKQQMRSPLAVAPGEYLNVDVAGSYRDLKRFVENERQISTIEKVALRISFIAFDDGTVWSAGKMLRPDPVSPERYVPVDNS